MTFGITGNIRKDQLWRPVADLVLWMHERAIPFLLHEEIAEGLIRQHLLDEHLGARHTARDLAARVDMVLSFGGDGTLLRTAHEVGSRGTPILGINMGRLGFLADVEVAQIQPTIERLLRGDYRLEPRMVLEARATPDTSLAGRWALNEFVLLRRGETGMVTIEVEVDGVHLNTYWADGLIIATPTGSTAYSLSVGGPILVPGCGAIVLTPIAPHTLTARPIVLPDTVCIEARVLHDDQPYVFTADGKSTVLTDPSIRLSIRRAVHTVNLVKLPEQHFFQNLRTKLMWGARKDA
ncbi:MAG: NAD kinase [Rhodothermaceae bacterium]|nr:MAG: ATP-NAD kinase [Bacteroidota bacterium]GIV62382.1 MAG: NAD kinase [Rhodothermaceae bacterium]